MTGTPHSRPSFGGEPDGDGLPSWRELFPGGRCIFYDGDDPDGFAREVRAEFGFDPAADPHWSRAVMHGPGGEEMPDPLGRSYGFHCPPEHLDAIYSDRLLVGS
jgi:hypothetical protein